MEGGECNSCNIFTVQEDMTQRPSTYIVCSTHRYRTNKSMFGGLLTVAASQEF